MYCESTGAAVAVNRTKIYVVRAGEWDGDRVTLVNVVAFPTRRKAETVVKEAKREDAYEHQYDDVEELMIYDNRRLWTRAQKVKASHKTRPRRYPARKRLKAKPFVSAE